MIRALTFVPFMQNSVRLVEYPEPVRQADELLVQGLAAGICGTDHDLVEAVYGWPIRGRERLILGHESLGRVIDPGSNAGFAVGDLVVGMVRRADPQPCRACAHNEPDMCSNGDYLEHGIKDLDGFAASRWTIPAGEAVKLSPSLEHVGVLLEPTSIVAKAWEHIDAIGRRAWYEPRRVLVTGAGPIGLLAALLASYRGLDVHVSDRLTDGPKPKLVRELGAHYHHEDVVDVMRLVNPDIIIEATGAPAVALAGMQGLNIGGILCLVGFTPFKQILSVDLGTLCRKSVVNNCTIFGAVSANKRHYNSAADDLAKADLNWLESMIVRRLPFKDALQALRPLPDDVKTIIDLNDD
jgi:glucose 1-dehydrogenase